MSVQGSQRTLVCVGASRELVAGRDGRLSSGWNKELLHRVEQGSRHRLKMTNRLSHMARYDAVRICVCR